MFKFNNSRAFDGQISEWTLNKGLENEAKIKFKKIYEGAYEMQLKLRRYEFSEILSLYVLEPVRTWKS